MNRLLVKPPHDAFVSFRGKDTRDSFISHLANYFAGSNPPINVFFDMRIKGGENIQTTLQQSLNDSNMYVIVFSENFPDSKWCLWELAEMVAASPEKKILPIFYGVTRDDVRLKTDLYMKKLSPHNASKTDMKQWMEGFKYVAEIEGLEWAPKDPAELGDNAHICKQTLERVKEMIGIKEQPANLQINLRSLPNLTNLEGLDTLSASNYKSFLTEELHILQYLVSQPGFQNTQQLTIRGCDGLTDIPHLGQLLSLIVLQIENCKHLVTLPDLSNLRELEQLLIINCPELKQVVGLSKLVSLQKMDIRNCKSLIYMDIDVSKVGKALEFLTIGECENLSKLGYWDDNDNAHDYPSSSSSDEECSNRTTMPFTAPTLCASDHHAAKVGLPVSSEVPEPEISEQLKSIISIDDGENSYRQPNAAKGLVINKSQRGKVGQNSNTCYAGFNGTDREEYTGSTSTRPTLDISVFSSDDHAVTEVGIIPSCFFFTEGLEIFKQGQRGAKEAAWDFPRNIISATEGSVDGASMAAAIKIVLPENVTSKGTIQNPNSFEFDGGGLSGAKEGE